MLAGLPNFNPHSLGHSERNLPVKRSNLVRKPKKEKKPSLNHPVVAPEKAVKPVSPKKRVPIRQVSKRRSQDNVAYAKHKASLPEICIDPLTGEKFNRKDGEHHHPAGRRKTSFLFVVPVTHSTHMAIHERCKQAELDGLLWRGRNSKVFTPEDAYELLKLVPFPETFLICIQLWEKTLNP